MAGLTFKKSSCLLRYSWTEKGTKNFFQKLWNTFVHASVTPKFVRDNFVKFSSYSNKTSPLQLETAFGISAQGNFYFPENYTHLSFPCLVNHYYWVASESLKITPIKKKKRNIIPLLSGFTWYKYIKTHNICSSQRTCQFSRKQSRKTRRMLLINKNLSLRVSCVPGSAPSPSHTLSHSTHSELIQLHAFFFTPEDIETQEKFNNLTVVTLIKSR